MVSLQQIQGNVITGIAGDKFVARQRLAESAGLVAGAVAAYADKQNNQELFAAVDFTVPALLRGAEQDCETHCANILKAGTANLAAMAAEQSLTQDDLDTLEVRLKAFSKLLPKPRQAKSDTKGATDQLPVALLANDRTLERQLDKLVERFRNTNPDFFHAYHVARMIVDPGSHPDRTDEPPPTPPPPAT